jgi:hypothetical protein
LDFDHDNRIQQQPWKPAGHITALGQVVWDKWYVARYTKNLGPLPANLKDNKWYKSRFPNGLGEPSSDKDRSLSSKDTASKQMSY